MHKDEPQIPVPVGSESTAPKDQAHASAAPPGSEPSQVSASRDGPASRRRIDFPVVGIGASAGGLAAFQALFSAPPLGTNGDIAFVIVQHLDPDHKSILIDLIKRYTAMQVYKVEDDLAVKPGCIYVIPPNRDMAFLNGKLHLLEPTAPHGLRLPIDFFFRSLAQEQRERAICIVLSGTGTDGTLGLKAVKEVGGMVMVQAPESAGYDGMPRSAIATGLVDYVLPPDKMLPELSAYVQRAWARRRKPAASSDTAPDADLQQVLALLRARTGHNFAGYKQKTVSRRVGRRMAVAEIDSFGDYVRYLQKSPREVESLFRELLIGVTSFFRDPDAWEVLQKQVLPRIFADAEREKVRLWVPACSTGEEAYSLAILIREYLDDRRQSSEVQVFATDIDAEAVEKARVGLFAANIAADVAPERLDRFFTQEDGYYRIGKSVRDMLMFATQDVLRDPPFSRVNLLSCRNLLIYLGAEAQKALFQQVPLRVESGRLSLLGHLGDHLPGRKSVCSGG